MSIRPYPCVVLFLVACAPPAGKDGTDTGTSLAHEDSGHSGSGDDGGSGSGDEGGSGSGDDGGSGSGDDGGAALSDFVNTSVEPEGALSCFAGAGSEDWLPQVARSGAVTTNAVDLRVEDFETGDRVEDATIEAWYGSTSLGTPDLTRTTNDRGEATAPSWPICSAHTVRASTDPGLGLTKPTLAVHGVTEPGASPELVSVSTNTYQLIPSLLGVSVDPANGVVIGTVLDCDGGPVTGAQVVATSSSGTIPEGMDTRYFVEAFPNRNQHETSDDGLFMVLNVPTGTYGVEAWVSDGVGGHVQLARADLTIQADSVTMVDLHVGVDGAKMPASCQ